MPSRLLASLTMPVVHIFAENRSCQNLARRLPGRSGCDQRERDAPRSSTDQRSRRTVAQSTRRLKPVPSPVAMAARLRTLAAEAGCLVDISADLGAGLLGVSSACKISAEKSALRLELRAAGAAAETDERELAALGVEVAAQAQALIDARRGASAAEEDAACAAVEFATAASRAEAAERTAAERAFASKGAARSSASIAFEKALPGHDWDRPMRPRVAGVPVAPGDAAFWTAYDAYQLARAAADALSDAADARQGEPKWHADGYVAGYKLLLQDMPASWTPAEVTNWIAGYEVVPDDCNWLQNPPSGRRQMLLTYRNAEQARSAKNVLNDRLVESGRHPSQT